MPSAIDARLAELGLELPPAAAPVANYVPFVIEGRLLAISGQIPLTAEGPRYLGRLGDTLSLEEGHAAARLCGLNIIAQARAALDGDLDRVRRIVRLGGFVAATPGFTDHPKVINGASDLMVEVFGEAGRHSRAATGAVSLPLGVGVEIDALIAID